MHSKVKQTKVKVTQSKQSNTQGKSVEKNKTADTDITMTPVNGETNEVNKSITPIRAFTDPPT